MKKSPPIKENFIDKAYWYVSPTKAARRYKARMFQTLTGQYVAGSRSKRSLSEWVPWSGDADSDVRYDLATIRSRSRDLLRNSPIAAGAVKTVCSNVVGPGLKFNSMIDREVLKMDDPKADAWESKVEAEFHLWAAGKDCDVRMFQTFYDIQRLAFRSYLESGDVFVLMPFFERQSPYGLKLQLVEADRVCNENNKPDSETLIGGVEKDKYGSPKNYHILQNHPGSLFSRTQMEWEKVPAYSKKGRPNVLHLLEVLRPGQTRGIPYFAPVMESIKQLDRYTEAELMAAVVSGYFTVFVKSAMDEGLSPMTPEDEIGGATTDEDYRLGRGAIVSLAPGEDISTAAPGRPNEKFDPFVTSILQQIGVALGMPFEVLIKHFSSSYSASRAALLEAWKFFLMRRVWFVDNFCQPVFIQWLDEAIARGRIVAPGYFADPLIRQAYLQGDWIGPSKGMIDELKEVQAARERIEIGISTRAEETAQLTGGDYARKHKQRVKEEKMRKDDGLVQEPPPPQPFPPKTEETMGTKPKEQEEAEAMLEDVRNQVNTMFIQKNKSSVANIVTTAITEHLEQVNAAMQSNTEAIEDKMRANDNAITEMGKSFERSIAFLAESFAESIKQVIKEGQKKEAKSVKFTRDKDGKIIGGEVTSQKLN